ncbi:hypothetical protein [Myxococcus fulvus]|uniref:hypothetical protein n=1 Tax=Myxococcus TaxID=32 RepID=UPI0020BF3760|nr:hypothetical protein [Myxococcus fulvus]MCK8499391.1 hypothetical protein [Myxococcus fulvus]
MVDVAITVANGTVRGLSEGTTTLHAKVGAVEAQATLEVIPRAHQELVALDRRYHVAASEGDNTFGVGLPSVEHAGAGIVYGVGTGNTAGASLVEATGGEGLVFDVVGPINWLAVMRVNGMDFDAVLAAAKTW